MNAIDAVAVDVEEFARINGAIQVEVHRRRLDEGARLRCAEEGVGPGLFTAFPLPSLSEILSTRDDVLMERE